MDMEAIRRISIIARTEGVDQASAQLQKLVQTQDSVAAVSEKTSRANLSVEKSYESLQRRVDVTHRAEQDHQRDVKTLVQAYDQGLIPSTTRLNELLSLSNQRYTAVAKGTQAFGAQTGLARYELINLSRQVQDVGVSLLSGQSPFTVLVQQGTQIGDVFASSQATMGGFWNQIKTGAAAVFTPLRVAGGAIAGLGTAAVVSAFQWSSSQDTIQRSLLGIGRASGATTTEINQIGVASSSAFGLSRSEAREFATTLAATGRIGVDEIGKVTALGIDVARVYGVDAAEAAKKLAAAYSDPVRGAEELNNRLGTFDAATQRNIQSLIAQNRVAEAQQVLTDRIAEGVKGINQTVSTGTSLWTALGNAASNAWNWLGEASARVLRLATPPQQDLLKEQIDAADKRLDALAKKIALLNGGPGTTALTVDYSKELDQVRDLVEQYEMLKRSARESAEERRAAVQSQANRQLVLGASPDITQFAQARDAAEGLARLMAEINRTGGETSPVLQAMGLSMKQVEEAAARAQGALDTMLTPAQQLTAQFNAQMSAINARTEQERVAAAEQEKALQLAGQRLTAEERAIEIQRAGALEIARSNAFIRDTLSSLRSQLSIAEARTGAERLSAQEEATINQLLQQGVSLTQAIEVASGQRAVTEAQIDTTIEQQIRSLRDQTQLTIARQNGDEASVAAAIAYRNAIEQGASGTQAAALAAATLANNLAQAASSAQQAMGAVQDLASAEVTNPYGKRLTGGARVSPLITGLSSSTQSRLDALLGSGNYTLSNTNIVSQMFKPQGINAQGAQQYQQGLADPYLQNAIASALLGGGSPSDIAQQVLSGSLGNRQLSAYDRTILQQYGINAGPSANSLFQALLDLDKRGGVAPEDTLAKIQSGVYGAGVDPTELLQAMDQLTEAVNSNTDAQKDILSSLYTTDPRTSRLGFRAGESALNYDPFKAQPAAPDVYGNGSGNTITTGGAGIDGTVMRQGAYGNINAFAYGGIMTEDGPIPLRRYAGGGIAYSPQAAIFGEGSTPEAFIPIPAGKVPVEMKGAAAARPVQIVNNFYIERDVDPASADEIGFTLYQQQQRLNQMLRSA